MLQELEFRVLEVYRDLDAAVAEFAAGSGLRCPEGCGRCCLSAKVEATVLECIPLAFELFRTLQAELILKRLEKNDEDRRCILYRPDFTEAGLGGCSQYRHRAVVCRLFGFAGNRDREGIPRLALCKVMKDSLGDRTVAGDNPALRLPLFSEAGLRITSLHPGMGTSRLPINEALMEALLKVGMYLELTGPAVSLTVHNPEEPPDKPLFPLTPPKRRAA